MLAYEVSIHQLNSAILSFTSVFITKYFSVDQIENNEMGEACSMCGGEVRCNRVLVGKSKGKRPRGIPRRRWENNVKMDIQEVGCGHGLD